MYAFQNGDQERKALESTDLLKERRALPSAVAL